MTPSNPFIALLGVPVLVFASAAGAAAQIGSVLPVDDATEDPSFFSFRRSLLVALAERDSAFLISHVASDIHLDFGGGEGLDLFRERWRPHDPDSEIWSLLAGILGGGGTYGSATGSFGPTYEAPHLPLPDGLDPLGHVLVLAEGVRVRAEASLEGEVLRRVSFTALPLVRESGEYRAGDELEWVRVRLSDGRIGYLHGDYADSPIGYRARFEKRDGRWMLTMLIAGD